MLCVRRACNEFLLLSAGQAERARLRCQGARRGVRQDTSCEHDRRVRVPGQLLHQLCGVQAGQARLIRKGRLPRTVGTAPLHGRFGCDDGLTA